MIGAKPCEKIAVFCDGLSRLLKQDIYSFVDLSSLSITMENPCTGKMLLKHTINADYNLALHFDKKEITAGTTHAHIHLPYDDGMEEALAFVSAYLSGKIRIRVLFWGHKLFGCTIYHDSAQGKPQYVEKMIYWKAFGIGRLHVDTLASCFQSINDQSKAQSMPKLDVALRPQEYRYFPFLPANLPDSTIDFFSVLNERLENHSIPLLDPERTQAFLLADGKAPPLRIILAHKTDIACDIVTDVYADMCIIRCGDFYMRLHDEDFLNTGIATLGALLLGNVEVSSYARGGLPYMTKTRFLFSSGSLRPWVWRFGRVWLGKREIKTTRVCFVEQ